MEMEHTDVAIVGGGLAGLTAACYLARAGRRVTVFEQAAEPGGRASTQVTDGFAFNRGAHALYTGGAASDVLRELGISYSHGIPKSIWVMHQGRLAPFPAGLWTLLRSPMLGPHDKLDLGRVFATLPRIKAKELANVSVQEWIEGVSKRPTNRRFIAGLARPFVYSAALDLVSAEVMVDKLQRALKHPIHYVDGGWRTIVDALQAQAEQAGVQIVSRCAVASIEQDDGRAHGLRLRNGRFVAATTVVIATTPRAALKLFDDGTYAPLRSVVEPLVPAHIACLDLALRRLPQPQYPVVQDLDQPRFMTAQSQYARIAPAGAALVHTFKQLDPRQAAEPAVDEQELEDLLDTAQPGWRDVVVRRVALPRIEAACALPLARSGGFAGRPRTLVPGLTNAYLAGDWVGDQGYLVDASMASARTVAQRILCTPVETPLEAGVLV